MIPPEYRAPYIASNAICVALLVCAFKWPRVTRAAFVAIFGLAAAVNAYTALSDPASYHDYANFALLAPYRNFIVGFFAEHTRPIVLAIASGQLAIALLLLPSATRALAVIGGVVFFAAITPLGLGAALPAPVLLALALLVMQCRRHKEAGMPT